jgi:MFS family permease
VIVAGLFLGVNNTLITEAVMAAAPVERGTASAAYSFVRFSGGAVAPWLAGKLGEDFNVQLPFYVGAFAVLLSIGALASGWKVLSHLRTPEAHSEAEATALTSAADA